MKIHEISVRRPVFAWMLMWALILFGLISYFRMGVSLMPDVDFPVVSVGVTYEGSAPEVMELNVVDPIEDGLMSIQGIKSLASTSRNGSASITVEFELGKDIDLAVQEIQNALSRIQRRLPDDLDPPTVSKSNPEDAPIMWLAVTSETLPLKELMVFVRDRLKDRFTTTPGVSEVFLGGYVDPNLRVWLSADGLNRYQLTIQDVLGAIQQEHTELPSGKIETKDLEYGVRTLGEALTPEEFSRIVISRRGGAPSFVPIPLTQVAEVEDGLADVRRKSRSNGMPAVGLGIRKQRGSNAVQIAHEIKKRLREVEKELPDGVKIGIRSDSTEFIEEASNEMMFTLILSALLTAVVIWMFIGSWSATLNVILAIPTSVIGSFIVLNMLGFTVNTFTILGLSLAIGIVVDDAIMVLENIIRHMEMGKTRMQAALDGTGEISFAALAATIAIIAIFLPVAFMKGIIGKFLFQFGVTLAVSVSLSLLEALTLTPMRASRYLKLTKRSTLGKKFDAVFDKFGVHYLAFLKVSIKHPWKTLAVSVGIFLLTLLPLRSLKKEFVPPQDQSRLMVRIQAPVGSSLDYTDRKFAEVEKWVTSRGEVDSYFGAIGGFGGGDVDTASLFVNMKDPGDRPIDPAKKKRLTQQEFALVLRDGLKKIPDIKVSVQDPSLSGFSAKRGFPIEFTVRGPDWNLLAEQTMALMKEMSGSDMLTDIDSDYRIGVPELHIIPNRAKASMRGVSVQEIDQTINAMIGGVVAGQFTKGGRRYDIRVRLRAADRGQIKDLLKLRVRNNRGELVMLGDVTDLKEAKSLQSISRLGRERAITVFANLTPHASQSIALDWIEKRANEVLKPGYRFVASGSAETFRESFTSLIFALLLGLGVSYMVLASQFNSYIHPMTVLSVLPFSISGAVVALWIGGQSINIYSLIGIILLTGIVKKNSILVVEFAHERELEGKSAFDAVMEAAPVRLRPVLMTSISTIAATLPPALAIGPGAESRIPMALAVLGGVFVSTVLSLLVVPCVYLLLSRFSRQEHH